MLSTRVKTLLSDVAAFVLSGASIKLLSFFMVPLYTYFLSTEEYAVADLVTLSIQLAIPLLAMRFSGLDLRLMPTENLSLVSVSLWFFAAPSSLCPPALLSVD